MQDNERQLNSILEKIVQEIAITPAMIDKAVKSYEAVGKWIGDGVSYDVQVSPQGSMNLGTTIKPITDKDDYDIDLVCMLKNGQGLDAEEIKNIVGDRLKENEIYRKKIAEEGEGKRCWKMQYDAFHMDILPCVPRNVKFEKRSRRLDTVKRRRSKQALKGGFKKYIWLTYQEAVTGKSSLMTYPLSFSRFSACEAVSIFSIFTGRGER